jgi:hypothetical protein
MLTGHAIETVKQSDWEKAQQKEEKLLLTQIPELTKTVVEKLNAAGYESAEDVLDAGRETILELKGFGEKTADRIFEILGSYYEEEPAKERAGAAEPAAPVPPQAVPDDASGPPVPDTGATDSGKPADTAEPAVPPEGEQA